MQKNEFISEYCGEVSAAACAGAAGQAHGGSLWWESFLWLWGQLPSLAQLCPWARPEQLWRPSLVLSGDTSQYLWPSTVEESVVCVPESPALALPHPWEPWQAPTHEVGGRAGGCFQEAGEHQAQPSAAESLKVISLYSSFHRMRLTGEERSTTSTCPASSSTSTMVTSEAATGGEARTAAQVGRLSPPLPWVTCLALHHIFLLFFLFK